MANFFHLAKRGKWQNCGIKKRGKKKKKLNLEKKEKNGINK